MTPDPCCERRRFLSLVAGALVAGHGRSASAAPPVRLRFKAVAFDAFAIFDPRPIAELTASLFAGRGAAIMDAWRTRQFEYQWIRALSGQYVDFLTTTEDSLRFVMRQMHLELREWQVQTLMAAYAHLRVWPDVPAALKMLRAARVRLVCLSNMTQPLLADRLSEAGLDGAFEAILSTDAIRSYKPNPKAYQMGVDALRLRSEEILFAAFAGWDVAGAKWFGYSTFWVNRAGAPMEELGVAADGAGADLNALVEFVVPDASR